MINLKTPIVYADKFEAMLMEVLAKVAKLNRVDKDGKTNFSFYPTKGEYLLITIGLAHMAEEERKLK